MYISRVHIENVRCFGAGEQAVDLDLRRPDGSYAGWTVIAGRNGAGKTSFLRALALTSVGIPDVLALQESSTGWVRHGAERGSTTLVFLADARDGSGRWKPDTPVTAGLTWPSLTSGERLHGWIDDAEMALGEGTQWAMPRSGWFIAGYGPFRRLTGETSDAVRLRRARSHIARLVSLFREDVALGDSIDWLIDINHRRLEGKPGAEKLETRILALLNDGLLPDGTRVLKVDSDGLWLEQSGIELTVHDLSEGYRTVIALVLDIVRQMYDCYDDLPWVAQQDRPAVDLPGIVLIDEVDAHLHVSWQQRIGFWLKERFPRVQFLVTTHSPFICQAADPGGLIRLSGPGEARAAEHVSDELYYRVVNGSADDAVLSDLFGLDHSRSKVAEAKLDEAAALEAKILVGAATAQDKERHEELVRELPTGPDAEMERTLRRLNESFEARIAGDRAEP